MTQATMTRAQRRLAARYERALQTGTREEIEAAQDAVIGDALYRRNRARMTPQARLIAEQGLIAAAKCARKLGIDFVDFYCGAFGRMPRLDHLTGR